MKIVFLSSYLGEFRDFVNESSRLVANCAFDDNTKYGSQYLCQHREAVIRTSHWSCCGDRLPSSLYCLTSTEQSEVKNRSQISIGDMVRIRYDLSLNSMIAANNTVQINRIMRRQIGAVGVVTRVLENGILRVRINENEHFWSPILLSRLMESEIFHQTDVVRVRDNVTVQEMESLHASVGYVSMMMKFVGKTGIIIKSFRNGFFTVDINGWEFCWNSVVLEKLTKVPAASIKDSTDGIPGAQMYPNQFSGVSTSGRSILGPLPIPTPKSYDTVMDILQETIKRYSVSPSILKTNFAAMLLVALEALSTDENVEDGSHTFGLHYPDIKRFVSSSSSSSSLKGSTRNISERSSTNQEGSMQV